MGTFTEVRFIEVGPSPNCLSPSVAAFTTSIMQKMLCLLVVVAVMAQLSCLTMVLDMDTALVDSEPGECHSTAMVLDSEDTGGRQMLTPPTSGAFQILSNVSGHPDPYMGMGGVSVM